MKAAVETEQQADHELVIVVSLGSQQTHTHTHTVMSAAVCSSVLTDSACVLLKGSM